MRVEQRRERTYDRNKQRNNFDAYDNCKKHDLNVPNKMVKQSYVPSTHIDTVVFDDQPKHRHQKLDYFAQLRSTENLSALSPLEKAAISAAQYLAMDPLEKMRRQVEQTVEAKLELLQSKLDNANDPKNKTQRKIYVGNLTPNINGEFLKQLFTQTLLISYPHWNIPGQDCVVEVQYRDGNKYCFLELRTMEMAMVALQVNGVNVLGTQLLVSRPTGFLDPTECERAVKEAELELTQFRSGEEVGVLMNQPGYTELVNNIRGDQLGIQLVNEVKIVSIKKSVYLSLEGVITACSLESKDEMRELYEAVKDKVKEYGDIESIAIPRPPLGLKEVDVIGRGYYGKIIVQFAQQNAADLARNALDGVIFEGRKVKVENITKIDFLNVLGIVAKKI